MGDNVNEYLGVYCKRAGISIRDLEEDRIEKLDHSLVTNGLVLELFNYFSNKSDSVLFSVMCRLLPEEVNQDRRSVEGLSLKLARVQKQKSTLRSKRTDFTSYLDKVFTLPPVCTTTQTVTVHPVTGPVQSVPVAIPLDRIASSVQFQVRQTKNSSENTDQIRELNHLIHEIQVKEKLLRHLNQLEVEKRKTLGVLDESIETLDDVDIYKQTINDLNANAMEQREKITRLELDLIFERLDKESEIKDLKTKTDDEIMELSAMHQTEKLKKEREQKKKHYYKCKSGGSSSVMSVSDHGTGIVAAQRKDILALENELCLRDEDRTELQTKTKGVYSISMRKCVIELGALEVAAEKIGPVIQTVGKCLFNHNFKSKNLPGKQCALNILDEGHWLVKRMYADKISEADNVGIRTDGTSRNKNKIMDTSLTLSTGEHLPLGFNLIATETADSIVKTTKDHMNELASVSNENKDDFVIHMLEKLSYCMSDRAANEKCAKRMLGEWRTEMLQLAKSEYESTVLHTFHCMAHALLGFHSYSSKKLGEMEKELGHLGRDADAFLRRWSRASDVVASRSIRMVSEVLGPCGDQKNGVADKWMDFMAETRTKSLLGAYKDNRFNAIFEVSAQVFHHRQDIINLLERLKIKGNKNPKVLSVLLDMKDTRLASITQALAICYVHITGPYWDMVVSGKVPYLELYKPIQLLHQNLNRFLEDPMSLVDDTVSVFPDFPPNRTSALYKSALTIENADIPILKSAIESVVQGIKQTVDVQLTDFLVAGKYGSPPTELERKRTKNSGVDNLECERHFGYLDASQNRRRHATFHHHSTILLLRQQGKNLSRWMEGQSDELWREARKAGVKLRKHHKVQEQQQHHLRQELLKLITEKKKKKTGLSKAKSLIQKAKVTVGKKKRGQAKKTRKKQKPIEVVEVSTSKWFAVAYENGWFPGFATKVDDTEVKLEFLHPTALEGQYRKPPMDDISTVEKMYLFCGPLADPVPISGGRLFSLPGNKTVENKFRTLCFCEGCGLFMPNHKPACIYSTED